MRKKIISDRFGSELKKINEAVKEKYESCNPDIKEEMGDRVFI